MQTAPTNLSELIAELQRSTVGLSKEQAFDIMSQLLHPSGLWHVFISEPSFVKALSEQTATSEVTSQTSEVTSQTSEVTSEVTKVLPASKYQDVSRILLTSARPKAQLDQLARSCLGVVLDFPSFKPLAIPCAPLNNQCDLRKLNYADYKIYEINDGTTVTLYYYNGAWCMSTANGIDVTYLNWMGPICYGDALRATAGKYPNFSFAKLDQNICYTIGFKFSDYHPLKDVSKETMWLISAHNLTTLETIDCDIGLPTQVPIVLNFTNNREITNYLLERNNNAILNYLDKTNPTTHYGFILRSDLNSYVVESSLLKQVRTMIYNQPKAKYADQIKVDHTNRLDYMILRSYLNCEARSNFKNLFPDLATIYYSRYDAIFTKLTNKILNVLRNTKQAREPYQNNKMDVLTKTLVAHIEKHTKINVMDSHGYGIVMDFITDPNYLELFFACIV